MNLNLEQLKAIKAGLEELKTKRDNEYYGICWNLDLGSIAYTFVEEFSVGWPHHTGVKIRPVPETRYQWKGEGLKLRLSLIDHLLKQVDKLIEETTK